MHQMYIKRIEIRNFQCHDSLVLNFGPNVNSIVGESERGKSATIRAIRWLLFNKPDGTQFRKHGTNATVVSATLDDDSILTRTRSSTVNRYTLERGDHVETYDNFGRDVPQPIASFLGLRPIELAKDFFVELNVSKQWEGPFLLGETGGIKAQVLGNISKTNLIDLATRHIASDARSKTKFLNNINESLKKLNDDLDKYTDLEQLKDKLNKIEASINELIGLDTKIKRAEVIANRLIEIEQRADGTKASLLRLENIPNIDEIEAIATTLTTIKQLDERGTLNSKRIIESEDKLKKLTNLDKIPVQELQSLAEILNKTISFGVKADDWRTKTQSSKRMLEGIEEKIKTQTNLMLLTIRKTGKCPFCFSELNEQKFEMIVNEVHGK